MQSVQIIKAGTQVKSSGLIFKYSSAAPVTGSVLFTQTEIKLNRLVV